MSEDEAIGNLAEMLIEITIMTGKSAGMRTGYGYEELRKAISDLLEAHDEAHRYAYMHQRWDND